MTFDVLSLRTTIPHKFGLEVLDYFLTTYQEDLHARFKSEFVLESTKFILKNNKLTFDSEFYLQIKRRVIIFVPIYAYSVTGNHEVDFILLLARVTLYPVNTQKIPG